MLLRVIRKLNIFTDKAAEDKGVAAFLPDDHRRLS